MLAICGVPIAEQRTMPEDERHEFVIRMHELRRAGLLPLLPMWVNVSEPALQPVRQQQQVDPTPLHEQRNKIRAQVGLPPL